MEANEGGPADDAGLRGADPDTGRGGDIIVSIDGKRMNDSDDVATAVSSKRPGDEIEIGYLRDGERQTETVELTERPASADSGGLLP